MCLKPDFLKYFGEVSKHAVSIKIEILTTFYCLNRSPRVYSVKDMVILSLSSRAD